MGELAPVGRGAPRTSKLQDRFIPNRKLLTHNYDKTEEFVMGDENGEENDPQNVSIT